MNKDRNFDDIAHKFAKNIYGSDKGEIRQTIVWQDMETILANSKASSAPLTVLDAGGGIGQVSQQMAKLGHFVTLCDISTEMLKLAEESLKDNGFLAQ